MQASIILRSPGIKALCCLFFLSLTCLEFPKQVSHLFFFFFKRTADTEDAFMGKYTRLCLVLIEHTHSTEQTQMNIFIDACQLQFFPE